MKKALRVFIPLAVIVIFIALAVVLLPYITLARTILAAEGVLESCTYQVQYSVSGFQLQENVQGLLDTLQLSVDTGRIAGEKQGELLHGYFYAGAEEADNEGDETPVLDFYMQRQDIAVNLKPVYDYARSRLRLGILSFFLPSVLPEDTYVSMAELAELTELTIGLPESDGAVAAQLDWRLVFRVNTCAAPETSAYADSIEEMYFFKMEQDGTQYIFGIPKKPEQDSVSCYIKIESAQREGEILIRCDKDETVSLEMPDTDLEEWQLQMIRWIAALRQ